MALSGPTSPSPPASSVPSPPASSFTAELSTSGHFDHTCWLKGEVHPAICEVLAAYVIDHVTDPEVVIDGYQYQSQNLSGWSGGNGIAYSRRVTWLEDAWAPFLRSSYTLASFNLEVTKWLLKMLFGDELGLTPWSNVRSRYHNAGIHDNASGIHTGTLPLKHP